MNYTSCLPVVLGTLLVMSLGQQVSAQQPPVEILTPTFSQHVAPIVYAKCIQCHRPGEVAPMSLINYRDCGGIPGHPDPEAAGRADDAALSQSQPVRSAP